MQHRRISFNLEMHERYKRLHFFGLSTIFKKALSEVNHLSRHNACSVTSIFVAIPGFVAVFHRLSQQDLGAFLNGIAAIFTRGIGKVNIYVVKAVLFAPNNHNVRLGDQCWLPCAEALTQASTQVINKTH